MNIYIHYGSKGFDETLYEPVRNREYISNKPYGGLWASDINAPFGWKKWNETEQFAPCDEDNSFSFTLREDTNVYVIDSAEKAGAMPIRTDRRPEIRQLMNLSSKTGIAPYDFEKMKEGGIDAIDFRMSDDRRLYSTMYGWDCDCLLVLDPKCIDIIKEGGET